MKEIQKAIKDSVSVKQKMLEQEQLLTATQNVVKLIVDGYRNGKKVLLCGNGGSASDAQHIAAELTGRFYFDREPLDAEALTANTSHLTAVGNDYSFDEIYARLVEAKGHPGDILIGLSTSGNSPNVVAAIQKGNEMGMETVALTGESGGKLKSLTAFLLNVPSSDTPRIQEGHILLAHIICEQVEKQLFERK
jgi:D-sedoheptulose 7-phosphate isomerase